MTTTERDDGPGAEVAVRADSDVAEVVDAELVPKPQPAPVTLIGTIVHRPGDAAREFATRHPRAVTAGQKTARVVVTTAQGYQSWARRAGQAATHGVLREQVRATRAAGDREQLTAAIDQLQKAKAERARRLKELPTTLLGLLKATAVAVVLGAGLLAVLGLGVHLTPGGWGWSDWWGALGWLATTVGSLLYLAAVVGMWAAVPVQAWAAWREGDRVGGTQPRWLLGKDSREPESVIVTPAGIAAALAHLGIAPLTKAIKDGWQVEFLTPPVRVNNRGYHVVFSLPMGVTPDMIADKRDVLARNLLRAPLEVWPTASERSGYVDLWVSDAGSTEKPAPEYPLLHDGAADVFEGIPFGVSQRGDVIAPPLAQANLVFGGMMGQGKSNAARVVMAGAALDPIAELRVFVFAANGDFDAYAPRLAQYEKGVGDEVAATAVETLRELYAEVGRREDRLSELGAKKVTRALALKHPDLRPIVALFSECHELFGHEEYGKEAADLAVQTLRRARKTLICLEFDTQSSRADAIPPKIVELVKINACFAVKTWRSNDGFLGDGSFQAGIRATELRPGKDVGTSVLTGATAERFELVKWYFIEVDDDRGFDAATELITRAVAAVHPAVPIGGQRRQIEPGAPRDLLEDLDAVLPDEPTPAADVPALLRAHAPTWAPYRGMTGKSLRQRLAGLGVKVASTGNRWPVDPVAVRAALARRATADLDDE